jgi:hypothetical protein
MELQDLSFAHTRRDECAEQSNNLARIKGLFLSVHFAVTIEQPSILQYVNYGANRYLFITTNFSMDNVILIHVAGGRDREVCKMHPEDSLRITILLCQPGTLVHTVHCELYSHVTLSHMITILVEYIIALHSSLNTTTFFFLSDLPLLGPPTSDILYSSKARVGAIEILLELFSNGKYVKVGEVSVKYYNSHSSFPRLRK